MAVETNDKSNSLLPNYLRDSVSAWTVSDDQPQSDMLLEDMLL